MSIISYILRSMFHFKVLEELTGSYVITIEVKHNIPSLDGRTIRKDYTNIRRHALNVSSRLSRELGRTTTLGRVHI